MAWKGQKKLNDPNRVRSSVARILRHGCSCCHLGLCAWERLISRRTTVPGHLQSDDDFVIICDEPCCHHHQQHHHHHMTDCCGEIRVWRNNHVKFGIAYFEAGKRNFLKYAFLFKFAPKSLISRNFSCQFLFVRALHCFPLFFTKI